MELPTNTNYYVKVFDNVLNKKFCQKCLQATTNLLKDLNTKSGE